MLRDQGSIASSGSGVVINQLSENPVPNEALEAINHYVLEQRVQKMSDQTNSVPYTINSNMEDIYSQLHDARMENASNRAEHTKLKREKKQLEAKIDTQEYLLRNL